MSDKEKSTFALNLKFLRKQKNCTQEELAQIIGIARHSIGSYEEGRAVPPMDILLLISKWSELSINILAEVELSNLSRPQLQLLYGEDKVDIEGKNLRVLPIVLDNKGNQNITMVNVKASAGYLKGYSDIEFIKSLPTFALPLPYFEMGTYRAFEIEGDSMLPLTSGTIVVGEYIEDWYNVKNDEIYVVNCLSGLLLKRVKNCLIHDKKSNTYSGTYILKSDNPYYDNTEIGLDEVNEFWKVKAYISRNYPYPPIRG